MCTKLHDAHPGAIHHHLRLPGFPSSATSNCSVELAGMRPPPTDLDPYASSGGMINRRLPPSWRAIRPHACQHPRPDGTDKCNAPCMAMTATENPYLHGFNTVATKDAQVPTLYHLPSAHLQLAPVIA